MFHLPVDKGVLVARVSRTARQHKLESRERTGQVVVGYRRILLGGDIITTIDGRHIDTTDDLDAFLSEGRSSGANCGGGLISQQETHSSLR